jgi:protein-L-isoaspartate(D-aspartate) O-methyltransferase
MSYTELRMKLVGKLVREGVLRTPEIIDAFKKVPRELFVDDRYRDFAYVDSPLPIGFGQTISAPHMIALMMEELRPRRGDRVLEVGTGSGYQTALLAEVVKPEGHVYSIEIIPELAEWAKRKIVEAGYLNYVSIVVGDGSKGLNAYAPYDKIIVSAASPRIPEPLIQQLRLGGRMVIPVGPPHMQVLKVVVKEKDGRVKIRDSVACVFVPLKGEYGW